MDEAYPEVAALYLRDARHVSPKVISLTSGEEAKTPGARFAFSL
jgi:hypothetical protein